MRKLLLSVYQVKCNLYRVKCRFHLGNDSGSAALKSNNHVLLMWPTPPQIKVIVVLLCYGFHLVRGIALHAGGCVPERKVYSPFHEFGRIISTYVPREDDNYLNSIINYGV